MVDFGFRQGPSEFSTAGIARYFEERLLQNAPFCSISASGSNFNPRNTQCIPAVKIIAFLELKQKLTFFKGLED